MTLSHGCDGLSARRMAVLWTFCGPSLCRHDRRELMRNALRFGIVPEYLFFEELELTITRL